MYFDPEEVEMIIERVPFGVTDWATVPETTHPGATGFALSRTVQAGNVRIRLVTYACADASRTAIPIEGGH